jgi:uncharacterized protein
MPTRDHYDNGIPSWVDLMTPDTAASRTFYGGLFGWDFTENPTDDPDSPYFIAMLDDRPVAGMMGLSDDAAAQGTPPCWSTYLAVDDIEVTFATVAAAGGQPMMPPMKVMDTGHMALLADPTGAVVGLWQAGTHLGAGLVNEHGTVTWNELQTPDPAAAAEFYGTLVGWGSQTMDMGPAGDYTVFTLGDDMIAGAMNPPQPGVPAHWSVVFATDDADATAAAAEELGGVVHAEPFDMPIGRLTVIADPHGVVFQAIRTNPSDQAAGS